MVDFENKVGVPGKVYIVNELLCVYLNGASNKTVNIFFLQIIHK